MEDIRAVVNDYGVALYINFATDKAALDALLKALGGARDLPTADRIQISYGSGLTNELAKAVLKRCGVPFQET